MDGYCVKCRAKSQMKDAKEVVKSGRKMAMGKCVKCGTNMCKILGKA